MAANDAWAHTPRQYKPSYSYIPNIPHSTSTPFSERPLHDFSPGPARNNRSISSHRRRTTSTFPRPDPGHSAPTVARSRLTASVSINDLSQPSPRTQRLRFPHLQRFTPTRIPTPVFDAQRNGASARHVSTPILPSEKKKENIQPKTLRLLGPVSPSRSYPTLLSKSRTMGMLSSLTSSFSRSNINMSSTRHSVYSSRTSDPTISISTTSSPPLPMFTTNTRQIHTAKPSSYWCGRFQALHDRFHNEILEASLDDPKIFKRYVATRTLSPALSKLKEKSGEKSKSKPKARASSNQQETESTGQSSSEKLMMEDEERRVKRAFLHLEALCVTNEAKKSLWEWQLVFARQAGNDRLLPTGAKMVDGKGGWVSRVGRALSGGMSGSGSTTSLGRISGLGGLGRRKSSMVAMAR